jgi:DNA-directed RNA polymerase subunit RPC12/RpoP
MAQCEECGKPIRPRVAQRIRKVTGGRLLCRSCMVKHTKNNQTVLVCRDCGEPIEPPILRRIARARRRGVTLPRLCRRCFLKKREPIRDAPDIRYEKDLKVGEWECANCGATLEPDEVREIRNGQVVQCEYCGKSISQEMFAR